MANVAYVRPELTQALHKWRVVRDCLEGEKKIKDATIKYLPKPNATDKSPANKARYEAYVERASFYPVLESTLEGLLGQVFDVDPVVEIPDEMDFIKNDATGSGITLSQMAMKVLAEVLAFGRAGILADYPPLDNVSRADVQNGTARPVIALFSPDDVINWRTTMRGAKVVTTLIVIAETYIVKDDGFEVETGPQWRELRCDAETGWHYRVTLWIQDQGQFIKREEYWPKDARGNALTDIPFLFAGALNNDVAIDRPPLYGIAALNIKHYRNSADYEDSVYMVGQPTPWASGLKKSWIDEVLKGVLDLGSRGFLALPEGASCGLLQAAPNSMVKEAMDQKEAQMVALGAQIVQPQNVSRTLGEAKMDKNSSTSILAKCAKNASLALTTALGWCALFQIGEIADPNEVYIQLSTTFAISKLSPQEQQQIIASWQGGAITWNEMRAQFRMAGIATEDDAEAQAEIDAEAATRDAVQLDNLENGGTPANPLQKDNPLNSQA